MTGFKPQGIDTQPDVPIAFGSNYNLKVGEIGVVVNDNDQWNGALLEIKEPLDPDGCYYSCRILIPHPKNKVVKPGEIVVWPAELIRPAATPDSTPRIDYVLDLDDEIKDFSVRWANKQGLPHRKDGPAVMCSDGTTEWWLNGLPHREDGPAMEYPSGAEVWYYCGKRHREDGPAVTWRDTSKFWYTNGSRHREGGPAVERADGTKEWWVNGEKVDSPELDSTFPCVGRCEYQGTVLDCSGSTCEIGRDGTKRWRNSVNQIHRIDGPAIEYSDASTEWRIGGQLHREDGPAILLGGFGHGSKYGGADYWYLNGALHREDGPAVTWKDTSKFWYTNGSLHREGGPAVEKADGTKEWWLNGKKILEKVISPAAKKDLGGVFFHEVSSWYGEEKKKVKSTDFEVTGKTVKFEPKNNEQSRGRCSRTRADVTARQISVTTSAEIDDFLRQGRQRDLRNQPRKNPTRRKRKTQKPKKSWKLKAALGLAALFSTGALIFFLG